MNMLMNAPGSTNTYGLPVSPATASAISVLPVPGGPHSRMPPGHVAALLLDLLGVLQEDDVLLDPLEHVVLAPDVGEPGLDVVGEVDVHPAPGQEPEDGDELDHDDQEQANTICNTNGSACQMSWGPRSSARIGVVWMILPVTTAMTRSRRSRSASAGCGTWSSRRSAGGWPARSRRRPVSVQNRW